MIINHENKYCFICVPKTGSKSISCALGQTKHPAPHIYHITAQELIDQNPDVENYMKFAFVRNPFSRLVSLYYDFTLKRKDMYSEFDKREKPLLSEFKDFEDFCIHLHESEWINDRFFWPQIKYVFYNNKIIDYIGKFERLNQDIRYILNNIEVKDLQLTRQNQGLYKEKDYRKYYSPTAKTAIQNLYIEDLMMFGYEF